MKRMISVFLLLSILFCVFSGSVCAAEGDMISGYYLSYNPMNQERSYYLPYFYSDGYFSGDSTVFNEHLATMSLNLAMAGMHKGEGDYALRHAPARKLLADIGCDDRSIYVSDYAYQKPTETSIGYVMGSKEITRGGETYTLIPITVRGNGYGKEWASNFLMGSAGEAKGIALAATQVYDGIEQYLENYNLLEQAAEGKLLFWITGYSRGGSVACLTAKRLVDAYGTAAVYAYPMEPLLCGRESEELPNTDYSCIHNLANYADIITRLPQGMGLTLYGQVHSFPSENAAAYAQQREKMLRQLAAIDASYTFDDSFTLAHLELTYSGLLQLIPDGIESIPLTDYSYAGSVNHMVGDWQQAMCEALVEWSVKNRSRFTDDTLFTYQGKACPGMEQAICTLTGIFLGNRGLADIGIVAGQLKPILDEVSDLEKLSLYLNVIKGWNTLSQTEKESYISTYWDKVEASGALSSYSGEDQAAIKECWPTLLYTLLPFVCSDYGSSAALFGCSSDNHEIFLGTMLYNGLNCFVQHDFILNLAWLRAFDSYYDAVPASLSSVSENALQPPVAFVEGKAVSTDLQNPTAVSTGEKILLDDTTYRGEMIFYTLQELGSGSILAEKELYRGGVSLPLDSDPAAVYRLTAWAKTDSDESAAASFCFTVHRSISLSAQLCAKGLRYTVVSGESFSSAPVLTAVCYDKRGKMRELVSVSLSPTAGRCSGLMEVQYNSDYTYRLFLTDGASQLPLCTHWCRGRE